MRQCRATAFTFWQEKNREKNSRVKSRFKHHYNFTLFALCRQPVVQAARKLRRVQLFKNAAECITVRYIVRKFEKISQKILSFLTKLFYISEVLPSAYYGTHSNDDILKLMADVSVSRSPRLSDIFHLFFQCFYVYFTTSPSKSKCCCPVHALLL